MQKVNQTYSFSNATLKFIKSDRKSVSLSVTGDVVTLRAPLFFSEGDAFAFLKKYRGWIERQLQSAQNKLSLNDGEKIEIFSEKYTIKTGRSGFVGDGLYLKREGREEHLIRLLKAEALKKMSALLREISNKYGFTYRKVKITSARTRWGSCNKNGTICFTFRVCFLKREALEYVAVHELCHTRQLNHGKKFWKEVEGVLPDWKNRQKVLKSSPAMSFL